MENKTPVVLSTSNEHKVFEMNKIAQKSGVEFILPDCKEFCPIEDGKTFEENAKIKALYASRVSSGELFLADDSGLCVDFLDGAPGIYSARYADSPIGRIEKLLNALEGTDKRSARFVCALCLVNKKGEILHETRGEVEGVIAKAPKGEGGFGYDPVFVLPELNKTMAELSSDEKNTLSHRGRALKKMLEWLQGTF